MNGEVEGKIYMRTIGAQKRHAPSVGQGKENHTGSINLYNKYVGRRMKTMSKKEELDSILIKINALVNHNLSLKGIHYIHGILDGRKNLGEYKEFKQKMREYRLDFWYIKSKSVYLLLDEYMSKTLAPFNRQEIELSGRGSFVLRNGEDEKG